jgi:hypothetical protein
MAKISAWLALAAAAAILIAAAANASALEFGAAGPVIAALLMCLAAWRTLAEKSAGMRLLCAGWGLTLGLAWYAPSYNVPDFVPGPLAVLAPVLVSAVGLALVVLHKEKKRA